MAKAGRGADQFPLRLPDGLREQIKRHAENNGRSMNSEIVSLIEYALWEVEGSRMRAGVEPFRDVTEEDWKIIHQAREEAARRNKESNLPPDADSIPFFGDESEPQLREDNTRVFLGEGHIDEAEFSRVLADENRKAFSAAMRRLGIKQVPADEYEIILDEK